MAFFLHGGLFDLTSCPYHGHDNYHGHGNAMSALSSKRSGVFRFLLQEESAPIAGTPRIPVTCIPFDAEVAEIATGVSALSTAPRQIRKSFMKGQDVRMATNGGKGGKGTYRVGNRTRNRSA